MAEFPSAVERAIARVAGRQHGLITTAQLRALALSYDMIGARERKGALIRVHHGVYRVGHTAPSAQADYLAAVLACGTDALLAGRACASNFGVLGGRPAFPEVVAPSGKEHRGIITRRAKLDPRDRCRHRGIPSLTVPALMIDLAPRMTLDDLGKVAQKADALYEVGVDAVAAAARRRGPFPGIAKLRELYVGDAPILLGELERRFHAVLVAQNLPLPRSNRRESEGFVDCRWPHHRLTVELDSYRFHRTRAAWEAAYRRRRAARARGDEFRAYTWFDVTEDRSHMLGELVELLVG
jgi:hypothetical protein